MLAHTQGNVRQGGIIWFPGCDPDNPNRPRAESVSLLRKDVLLERLAQLLLIMLSGHEEETDFLENTLIFMDDILKAIGCYSDEDRRKVFGVCFPVLVAIVDLPIPYVLAAIDDTANRSAS
jgi:hypothetical protein